MFWRFGILLLMINALIACGGVEMPAAADQGYAVIRQPEIGIGDPIPPPAGEVILTVTGKIGNPNVGDTLQLDLDTLERLGVVEYRVEDKQAEGRAAVFQGVLVSQLLAAAGAAAEATVLKTVALNDYAIEIPLEDIEAYPVLLATAVDGQRMPVERYGPTRIIYPYDSYDFDETIYDPRWIWQLATIDVR